MNRIIQRLYSATMQRGGMMATSNVSSSSSSVVSHYTPLLRRRGGYYAFTALSAASLFGAASLSYSASSETKEQKMKEERVAGIHDMKDGDMKDVQVNGVKILLTKLKGEFHATALKCTHFGAPLNTGVLHGEVVSCPWHAAQFNVITGESISAPALDSLPVFPVRIEGEDVYVAVPEEGPTERLTPSRKGHKCKCQEHRVYVIVGGGAAGVVAAQTIRQNGFRGRLVLVTKEDLPYDRTLLSKNIGVPAAKATLRDEAFYKMHDIEVMRNVEVKEVDVDSKHLTFDDGASLSFDKILLATGSVPKTVEVPGNGLDNVFTLRTIEDSNKIAATISPSSSAVIVGASFIGLETAACLKKNKKLESVTVVANSTPFAKSLGPEVGAVFQKLHEDNGVKFKIGRGVDHIEGQGKASGVVLDNGEVLPADLVVFGVGVQPQIPKLKGLSKEKDGGISVDQYMSSPNKDVYAAGDIARFPYNGENVRIEHWCVAQDQGRVAAHNMTGQAVPYSIVPFFWTNQYGVGMGYAGHTSHADDIIVTGDVKNRKFVAYYVKDGKIEGVAAMGSGPVAPAAQQLLKIGKMPSVAEVRKGDVNLVQILKSLNSE